METSDNVSVWEFVGFNVVQVVHETWRQHARSQSKEEGPQNSWSTPLSRYEQPLALNFNVESEES